MSQERKKQMTTERFFTKYQYRYMFQSHEVTVRLALEHTGIL